MSMPFSSDDRYAALSQAISLQFTICLAASVVVGQSNSEVTLTGQVKLDTRAAG
jgi:hypothetical protein